RQVQLQLLPGVAAVVGKDHAALGAGIEKARALRVFADDVQINVLRQAGRQAFPGVAVVGGLVQVRLHVVEAVGVGDDVGGACIEMRSLDAIDSGPFGLAGNVLGDARPGFAVVA